MSQAFDVAVLGATGLVGQTMIELLEARGFPINTLYPLASKRSAGGTITYKGCLLYTSPSPRDQRGSRMPSSA